ncbi:MAG: glutamate racemase [Chitinophagaceae bacterium]|nr:glutamate racemase [Chitinophagaceae bacterium]
MQLKGSIGIFDSGFGGLTVLKEIVNTLPQYNYLYMGDNARAPYGTRSFETVYQYTWQCVQWFFKQGCPLVILACNTASAKALRNIQQNNLPYVDATKRVLGVIRPTTEVIGNFTQTKEVGILGTNGTVQSNSYPIEMQKFYPEIKVFQQACPMWVPLIENNEHESSGADFFVQEYIDALLQQSPQIDTILLACTHYPLLMDKIKKYTPTKTKIISQGEIVATSLKDYLLRHPEMEQRCTKNSELKFYTTDSTEIFDKQAKIFFGKALQSKHVVLDK